VLVGEDELLEAADGVVHVTAPDANGFIAVGIDLAVGEFDAPEVDGRVANGLDLRSVVIEGVQENFSEGNQIDILC